MGRCRGRRGRTGWSGTQPGVRLRLHPLSRARVAAVAIIDTVSRKWITTVVSADEYSVQVEVAFTAALDAEGVGVWEAADARATAVLVAALASGDRDAVDTAIGDGQLPAAARDQRQRPADTQSHHPRVPRQGHDRPAVRPPGTPPSATSPPTMNTKDEVTPTANNAATGSLMHASTAYRRITTPEENR